MIEKKDIQKAVSSPYAKWLGIGVAGYILFRVGKNLLFPSSSVLSAAETVKKSKQTASYPDLQYKIYADKIYQAGYVIGGTDEGAIYDVFKAMNNDLDVAKLILAFGKRRIEFSFQEGSLPEFLTSELDEDEVKEINKILQSKGIVYRF